MGNTAVQRCLVQLELALRAGRILDAQSRISLISTKTLSRVQRTELARSCLRAGLAEVGLRLLQPVVRENPSESSSEERAVFAACLNSNGGTLEANAILESETDVSAWTELYRSFVAISMWDYKKALSTLDALIESKAYSELPEYVQRVVRVNRLASLIAEERWSPAEEEISQLKFLCMNTGTARLLNNLRELELQVCVAGGQFDRGRRLLLEGSGLDGLEQLYFTKWKAILQTAESPEQGAGPLLEVLKIAREHRRWEVVRDLEARIAVRFKSPIFLKRVLYATPWPKYRERILGHFASDFKEETFSADFDYHLLPGVAGRQPPASSDLPPDRWPQIFAADGRISDRLKLKSGFREHRLLRSLASDLFGDHSSGSLFNAVFPDEFFNPHSSPGRVHHAVRDLRAKLSEAESALTVEQVDGKYRLSCTQPVVIWLPLRIALGKSQVHAETLRDAFGNGPFQVSEVADRLTLSLKTAQRVLRDGVDRGLLERTGNGKSTKYTVKDGSRRAG